MIVNFIDDMKRYIKTSLVNNDVENAYMNTTLPKAKAIRLYIANYRDVKSMISFDKDYTEYVLLQVFVYDKTIEKAYDLAYKVKQLFDKDKIIVNNSNVTSVRINNISPALPVKEGSQLYASSVRIAFTVKNPYDKVYKGE